MSDTFPVVVTAAGLQPTSPVALRQALLNAVAATNPGYTANLPGSLIEDIASTDVAAIALADAARVELVNSLTPYGANDFLLRQLGNIYGVPLGRDSTTSVLVVFSGSVGFVISAGFTVSDGTYQYVVQTGGVVGTTGVSGEIYALATTQGSWAVPADTVTQLITSVPESVTLTVSNPDAGLPGTGAQTAEQYRAQVLQAGLAVSQGMPSALRAALQAVPDVQPRLVAVRQQSVGWEVICGGGDPYQVAYAIFIALFDISTLVGSTIAITDVTQANPGVVTTDLNHGYTSGDLVTIDDVVGMTALNGNTYTATVIDEKTFSIGVNTSGFGAYVSGGVITPNGRNQVVSLYDFPDIYEVRYVQPPQQVVDIAVTWNTTSTNLVPPAAVAQLGAPALVTYVNSIVVGQPMNLFEMQAVFTNAVASLVPPTQLTRMVFAVSINGVGTTPLSGTGIIEGDPESYFYADVTNIDITQG
jgi:hypothetical protein